MNVKEDNCLYCKSNCTVYLGSEGGVNWYKCLDCKRHFNIKPEKVLSYQEQLMADYGKIE